MDGGQGGTDLAVRQLAAVDCHVLTVDPLLCASEHLNLVGRGSVPLAVGCDCQFDCRLIIL